MFAVNCWVCPNAVDADTGVITMGETRVSWAFALSPPLVAVAVTVQVVLGYNGALYRPLDEIDPHVVVQFADALAVNCWVAFSCTVPEAGVTENTPLAPIVSDAAAV